MSNPNSSRNPKSSRKNKKYRKESYGKSVFDGKPTLIIYRYVAPVPYRDAIMEVIRYFQSGISFNKAVDRVAASDTQHLNRDKLAHHTLKYLANDY